MKMNFVIIGGLVFFILLVVSYLYYENNVLEVINYDIKSEKISKEFDGYLIAQISDFHNTSSVNLRNKLVEKLEKNSPNIIVITGDFLDAYNTNMDIGIEFIEKIEKIAPIYFVTGNHESRVKQYSDFEDKLKQLNVNILNNESITIKQGEAFIELIGLQDTSFYISKAMVPEKKNIVNEKISNLVHNNGIYKILLCHRPELFECYVKNNIDLVFTGHAHGGQFRIPFIGGVFAPNQGFLPKYTKGVYTQDSTNMVVSTGIGKSRIPFRINNRPELILVKLEKE